MRTEERFAPLSRPVRTRTVADSSSAGEQREPAVSSTPERILATAVELFNAEGVQSVPMHRIAAEVGISPGNLAYHFRNKRDLLFALLPRLEAKLSDALPIPEGTITAAQAVTYQINLFRTLWRQRFFFNALTNLLSRDEELRTRYMTFQDHVVGSLTSLLDGLVHSGAMRAVSAPNTTALLAMNMWLLWLSWLRLEQINNPQSLTAEDAAVFDGALHHFSLMQSYYSKRFGVELFAELERMLSPK